MQGIGLGGIQALVIIVIAAMISPRERGRYTGHIAAVMSLATVAGPLIGGVIVDTSWLGWRWCFYVGVPIAAVALVVVQRTLHLPVVTRKVTIDYLGATLLVAGVSDLLVWVTLAGKSFAWDSTISLVLVAAGVVLLGVAVYVETRAAEPIIPLWLFRVRTTTLATLASVAVGVALSEARSSSGSSSRSPAAIPPRPPAAGLLSLPMILGSMVSATGSGALITRTGHWKVFLVTGSALMTLGFGLLATIDHQTDMRLIGAYLLLLGLGLGMTMQNLVLSVQNTVAARDLGAASATVSSFRSLGGTIGVSVLGAILATRVTSLTTDGLAAAGLQPASSGPTGIGQLNELPPAIAEIVQIAYGDSTARIFLVSAILAALALVTVAFIREIPLRAQSGQQLEREQERAESVGAGTR